jgi:BirA family biotin operon repressor/biotin-[acetyl-CoA-carboxylase] ligase
MVVQALGDDALLALLRLMSDGRGHGVDELRRILDPAGAVDVVGYCAQHLEGLGLPVEVHGSEGLRLAERLDLLDERRLIEGLGRCARIGTLQVVARTGSTNTDLMNLPHSGDASAVRILLAECQTQGRGRRGNRWRAGCASSLTLSMMWELAREPHDLGCLSLAIGTAVAGALAVFGLDRAMIKWPNDLYYDDKKLGGVLLEGRHGPGGCRIVAGIGINGRVDRDTAASIDQPWIDLETIRGGRRYSRSELAVVVMARVIDAVDLFLARGFEPFRADWRRLDLAVGRRVKVVYGRDWEEGVGCGIDETGCLLIRRADGLLKAVNAGEVSLQVLR